MLLPLYKTTYKPNSHNGRISSKHAKEFGCYYSEKFEKDLIETKQFVENIMKEHKKMEE